jgi:DtxR family transcriptional regulator, Mn-dependent transcriptional regulator
MQQSIEITRSVGDYLKGIYTLTRGGSPTSTMELAEHLDVAPASVTNMIKRLAAHQPALVDYTRHRGVELTGAGELTALRVIRRHRLVELFLVRVLGYTWDEVHVEAEELEHVISARFEDRLARLLEEPNFDPHGEPIPGRDLGMPERTSLPLNELAAGERGQVEEVYGRQADLLLRLGELGLRPGVMVEVVSCNPLDHALQVRVLPEGVTAALGAQLGELIRVSRV